MLNLDINELTRQLKDIRLERASSINHLDRINKAEIKGLKELEKVKNKVTVEESCPFVKGDILRVTNCLRDKYGKVGKAKKICKTQVTIQNSGTGKKLQSLVQPRAGEIVVR